MNGCGAAAMRIMDVRQAYCIEDFEWEMCKNIARFVGNFVPVTILLPSDSCPAFSLQCSFSRTSPVTHCSNYTVLLQARYEEW